MKSFDETFATIGTTIFTVMSALASEHGAINLGQGFPDGNGPDDVREAAVRALREGPNQYPPMMGLPELRQAVAANGARFFGVTADWREQVLVTSGATEALAASLLALLEPGDEAVLFEPLYDSYAPMVRRAGARPRLVRLEPPDWSLPQSALAAAFGPKTKVVVLNTPMNPIGKVFSRDELAMIADLVIRHDSYAICDEVYEHLVFSGQAHVPLSTLPGMAGRALRIGSAGKTFALTGWKVGYLTGAPELIAAVARAHQFLTFTTPPNLQRAVAYGLGKEDCYFHDLAASLEARRDQLSAGLAALGMTVLDCAGGYFITADIRPLETGLSDVAFCQTITREAGVAAVPVSAFYEGGEDAAAKPDHFVRFCFCKQPALLDEAVGRLGRYFG